MSKVVRANFKKTWTIVALLFVFLPILAKADTTIGTDITTAGTVFIGTSSPSNLSSTVYINGNQPIETHSNYANGIYMYTHADAAFRAPYLNFYKSRGSQSSPTALTYTGYELDSMGGINFGGYDGTDYGTGAAIYSNNTYDWTPTNHEGHISIYFTRNGFTTQNQMVQFGGKDANGNAGNNAIFYWPLNFSSNSTNGVQLQGLANGGRLEMVRGDGTDGVTFTVKGIQGVGTSTPVANFQVTNVTANATTTIEWGKANQNKGSCLKLYRTDGSAVYAYVAAGTTAFTLSTSACATVTSF